MKKSYDVVIIGGGVSGSSTAYFLAAHPDFDGEVLVVERDPTYEHAPSARATGGIRQQFSTSENIEIGLYGAHFVKNIGEYLSVEGAAPGVGFKEHGYLLLASDAALSVMQQNHALQRELGANVDFHSPAALERRFPWLKCDGLAGGFLGVRDEGWLDPYALLQAFRHKARSLGVRYVADEAIAVTSQRGRITGVRLRDAGQIAAGIVLNAAGARDAAKVAAWAGVRLPVEPRKRCTFVFRCREDIATAPLTIFPQGVAFRPEGAAFLSNVAPPPERDTATDDMDIDYDLFDDCIWPLLARHIPAFEAIKLERAYCCHYDFNTLDENVILGHTPGFENFYLAAGFSGHGLMQSPAIGRGLSELMIHGEFRSLDLSRLSYERVRTGAALRENNCY